MTAFVFAVPALRLRRCPPLARLMLFLFTGCALVAASPGSGSTTRQAAEVQLPVGATLQSDIPYGPDSRQRYDAYVPVPTGTPAPIVFMVHGGAWKFGDKAESNVVDDKVARWVARGFVFISVNYPMLPDADPLMQAEYVARALAFVQQNAANYNADPARVILMGHSAGAHLVSLISTHPTLAASQGVVTPWLGTVSLDSAAFDVTYLMVRPHLPLYDEAFGADPQFWAAASPYQSLVQPVPPILSVCSSFRVESQVQSARFAARGQAIGSRIEVLTKDYTHEEINEKLGEPIAYTDEVEAFLRTLDSGVAARLDQGPAAAPVITTQPADQIRAVGGAVTFAVTVTGNPAPTCQWNKNGVAIPGATAVSLTLAAVGAGDAGSYAVVVTNPLGSVISNVAQLSVLIPPDNAVVAITVE